MSENTKTPRIRFKGFTDAWEQRKLGEIANIQKGQQLGKAEMSSTGTYYVLNGGMEASGFTNQYNTLANTISISEGGNSCGYVSLNLEHFWSGGHNYTLQNLKINTIFLYQWLKRQEKRIMALRVGSGLPNIQKSSLQDVYVKYSTTTEQQAIALFLIKIDNLITLHQRKCDKLKNIKAALLEKMFPQGEAATPKIRFKGFTDAWEQRKVNEVVASVDTGRSHFQAKMSGKYEILGSTAVIGYDDEFDYQGEFLLTARVGANAGTLYRHSGKVKISDNTVFLQGNNLDFMYYALFNYDLKKLSFGTGQPLVKASELKKLSLILPSSEKEKKYVGRFFEQIDNLITLHQRKLKDFHGGFL